MDTAGCFLGLDIGTTGVKAVLFADSGEALGSGLAEYTLETPRPDIVELDAGVYWQSVRAAIASALASSVSSLEAVSTSGAFGA